MRKLLTNQAEITFISSQDGIVADGAFGGFRFNF